MFENNVLNFSIFGRRKCSFAPLTSPTMGQVGTGDMKRKYLPNLNLFREPVHALL